jgi:hypothetical protein
VTLKRQAVRIGWAARDITPTSPCELAGQYYRRVATDIRDRLQVTAWAVESGAPGRRGQQAVMASVDVVGIAVEVLRAVRRRVAGRVRDLDPRCIILSAIHTHNAPPIRFSLPWLKRDPSVLSDEAYSEQVIAQTVDAIEEAWRRRKPGYVSWALGQARVGHCRRAWYADGTAEMYGRTDRPDFLGMEAGEDSGVDMVFCWDGRKKPTGVVVNVPCPSQVMEATYRVTADYMGEVRRLLREQYGRGFHVLPQISAAGDQSPRDLTRNYRGAEPDLWHEDGVVELGGRVAATVVSRYKSARSTMRERVEFAHVVKALRLPVWRATPPDYRRARAMLRGLQVREPVGRDPTESAFERFVAEMKANEAKDGPGPYDSKLHDFVIMQICRAVMDRYRTQDARPRVPVELHALRLGDVAFATNPFELFLDYGSRIKARSPARQTFLVQLCCGGLGYLPTARAVARGGYGATMASAQVGPEGGDKLVEASVRAVRSMWRR